MIIDSKDLVSQPKFKVGTIFNSNGKHKRQCTVIDIHKTYDMAGCLVKVNYVATHDFLGQVVTDRQVCETTIARGLISSPD